MIASLLLFVAALQDPVEVGPNDPNEPIAKEFSLERGRKFMDDVSLQWQRQRN